jgi:hypothetical protein
VAIALLVLLAVVLIWQAFARPAAVAAPSTAATSAQPSRTSETNGTTTSPAGCPATAATTPVGAAVHTVLDVDGDGRPDVAWLTTGADRRFGITTASGATFSAAIVSASPLPAAAIVQVVQGDLPIALVDLGREAFVYSLLDCAITAPKDARGAAYTFDRGFAGQGTGVGCSADAGKLRLAGLNAVQDAGASTYTVTRTWVDLSTDGRTAANGASAVVATGVPGGDRAVTAAREVSCGDLVAGRDGPVEPR